MLHEIGVIFTVLWLLLRLLVVVGIPAAFATRWSRLVRFARLDRARCAGTGCPPGITGSRSRGWRVISSWPSTDKHLGNSIDSARKPKVNYPKARFRADSFGWTVNAEVDPRRRPRRGRGRRRHLANHGDPGGSPWPSPARAASLSPPTAATRSPNRSR